MKVTHFLTVAGLERSAVMIEAVSKRFSGFEVVCNDWRIVQWLVESKITEPIIGRLLVG